MRLRAGIALVLCSLPSSFAQQKVRLQNMHERIVCIVPMVGAGTPQDPRRPMFAPLPSSRTQADRSGIIAFTFQESDDGRYALVEFVARDRSAFDEIRKVNPGGMKIFRKGQDKREDVEREFRKLKRNFNLDQLSVGAL